ncbi:MAG: hypothetical protein M2R45_00550 [Verrucomicrobia subdivision 3 bacterium]|nr:hypothetical protein [Limisphaerales bacterium]MCS1413572.1 hypothetical protein [Limisphaerales bacterium]
MFEHGACQSCGARDGWHGFHSDIADYRGLAGLPTLYVPAHRGEGDILAPADAGVRGSLVAGCSVWQDGPVGLNFSCSASQSGFSLGRPFCGRRHVSGIADRSSQRSRARCKSGSLAHLGGLTFQGMVGAIVWFLAPESVPCALNLHSSSSR